LVSVDRNMLAKCMKRAPMACLDVSKILQAKRKNESVLFCAIIIIIQSHFILSGLKYYVLT